MNLHRINTCFTMTLKMLSRRRIALILIIVIPIVFLSVVSMTTSILPLPFLLSSVGEEVWIQVGGQAISFIFFAVASAGFLVSFVALDLIRRDHDTSKRLIISGYHPLEILLSKLLVLLLIIVLFAIYISLLTLAFYRVEYFFMFCIGLVLIGFVYGCYGLVIGSLVKGELEGILLIVLLANIDAGWLQNPVFYSQATNQEIIRFLPAYFPSQVSIIGAFTEYSILNASLYSFLYGFILLVIAMILFFTKMRLKR